MNQDLLKKYYLELDHNCAESTLLAANDQYELGVKPEDMKLVSGFGGGMGCGSTCGALCSCISILGKLFVDGRAHATEGFGPLCAEFVQRFEQELGSTCCAQLKEKYFVEGNRCLATVLKSSELLEAYIQEIQNQKDTQA